MFVRRIRTRPRSRLTLAVWVFALLVVLPVVPASSAQENQETPATLATPDGRPAIGTPIVSVSSINASLAANIDPLVIDQFGVYGVVILDDRGQQLYRRNGSTPFLSASLYKLPLMATIYAWIEAGELSLDQPLVLSAWYYTVNEGGDSYFDWSQADGVTTIGEALFATGAYSSNVGALALASLTGWPAIQDMAHRLGMTGTYLMIYPSALPDWPPAIPDAASDRDRETAIAFVQTEESYGPTMITTPDDIARFFLLLLHGEIVSPDTSAAITAILTSQMVNDRIPARLPATTVTVHKTGNLSQVVHDAGIVYTSTGPIILAALSQAEPDDSRATTIIQEIAQIAFALAPSRAGSGSP